MPSEKSNEPLIERFMDWLDPAERNLRKSGRLEDPFYKKHIRPKSERKRGRSGRILKPLLRAINPIHINSRTRSGRPIYNLHIWIVWLAILLPVAECSMR